MPYKYYFDHTFTEDYLTVGRNKDPKVLEKWLEDWVYSLDSFDDYLVKLGPRRLYNLRDAEFLRDPVRGD
jgi:hypothetical protein